MQPTRHRLSLLDRLLSLIEHPKMSDRLILRVLFFTALISGLWYLISFNSNFVITTPTSGGELKEGIVGIPRFVNPALAITRADQDTTTLIYSGLLKIGSNGDLVPDIAEAIEVSEDGTIYNVKVKRDRTFHDGTPITARDVIFTIELMQDPDLKSPLRGNWVDVQIESIDEYEFNIILSEAYSPFIENFTFGIMPSHIWDNLPIEQLPFSQYNTEPIGSGPFMIDHVIRDASGLISGYVLKPSPDAKSEANLSAIELKYYQNEDFIATALFQKEINATVFLPTHIAQALDQNQYQISNKALPRVFGLFFNQNRSIALRDKAARQALSVSIDREAIINQVLGGYGVPIENPIVKEEPTVESLDEDDTDTTTNTTQATTILEEGGWKKTEGGGWEKRVGQETQVLAITIKTGNSALFDQVANLVAENWRSLGVEVQVEQYEQSGLVQSVIRSRDFQALLFGVDLNRQQDLFPFWHSSQKDDPGLNIAQYTNVTVDSLLETARATNDEAERQKIQDEISAIISDELPAIFLFAPSMVYVTDKSLYPAEMTRLAKPSDRFMNIEEWHAKTDSVWPIFQNNN